MPGAKAAAVRARGTSRSITRLLGSLTIWMLTATYGGDFVGSYIERFKSDGRISDLVSSKYELHLRIVL